MSRNPARTIALGYRTCFEIPENDFSKSMTTDERLEHRTVRGSGNI
jgi:hypothetical protein